MGTPYSGQVMVPPVTMETPYMVNPQPQESPYVIHGGYLPVDETQPSTSTGFTDRITETTNVRTTLGQNQKRKYTWKSRNMQIGNDNVTMDTDIVDV